MLVRIPYFDKGAHMLVGYGRVSTEDQDPAVQLEALKAAGCEKLYSERKSGSTTEGRTQLAVALDFMREGDTLVITKIDRLPGHYMTAKRSCECSKRPSKRWTPALPRTCSASSPSSRRTYAANARWDRGRQRTGCLQGAQTVRPGRRCRPNAG
jgi:hypothetical protein